jgi:ligand-binding sensor domain-containing protein/signal transduction histidine kinase
MKVTQLFSLFCSVVAVAIVAFFPTNSFSQTPLQSLPLKGLPSAEATCALQDKYGFLWFGTENGLCRWDGVQMRTFTRRSGNDTTAPQSNTIRHLHEDNAGTLWIATSGGLCRFYRHNETFSTALPGKDIAWMTEDRSGTLWVQTQQVGMSAGDLFTLKGGVVSGFPANCGLRSRYVNAFCVRKNGEVWLGTTNGLYRFDAAKRTFTPFLTDDAVSSSLAKSLQSRVNAIAEENNGTLLVGTSGGLFRLQTNTGVISAVQGAATMPVLALFQTTSGNTALVVEKQTAASVAVRAVRMLSDGNASVVQGSVSIVPLAGKPQQMRMDVDSAGVFHWGVANGLLRFDARAGALTLLFAGKSSPESIVAPVTSVLRDRAGSLWWTRLGAGVFNETLAAKPFHTLGADVVRQPLSALFADRAGNVWFGVQGGKYSTSYNPQMHLAKRIQHASEHPTTVGAFTQTIGGEMLAATDALERTTSGNGFFTRFPLDATQPVSATSIVQTKNGTLWIGTRFGLYTSEQTGNGSPPNGSPAPPTFRRLLARAADSTALSSPHIGNNSITALLEDSRGTLWIGHEGGLDRYNPQSRTFTHLRSVHSNNNDFDSAISLNGAVTCLMEDSRGNCWIGSSAGLQCFDRVTGRITERLLSGEPVNACVEDKRGTLWISSLHALYALNVQTRSHHQFEASDGLPDAEFLDRAAARTPDGRLWFGARGQTVLHFHPDSILTNAAPPPVVLTGVKKFGSPAPLERYIADMDEITFRHDETVIAFEFVALNFVNSAKNRYAYILEGFDKTWNEAGLEREAKYTNLPPGEYLFRVKAANNDGIWNEAGARLRVVVLPPWWATWWFRVSALLLVAGGLAAAYRARTKALDVRNRELERVVGERTLELKNAQTQLVQSERLNAAGMLTAGVMHEINNPNAAMLAALQLANAEVAEAEAFFVGLLDESDRTSPEAARFGSLMKGLRESLAVALDGSQRIRRIVAGLQGFTKHQRDGVSVHAVREEIASTIEIVRYQFGKVAIVQNIPLDLTLEAHWSELNQAVLNLLVNAAQAHASTITVSGEERGNSVVISIADDGDGMSDTTKARIFEPFFTTKDVGNSGLGMSITKNILEKHGARIEVESSVGVGTTVRMVFG